MKLLATGHCSESRPGCWSFDDLGQCVSGDVTLQEGDVIVRFAQLHAQLLVLVLQVGDLLSELSHWYRLSAGAIDPGAELVLQVRVPVGE